MDASTAAASLGIAVAVATVIGIVKTALPKMDNRFAPALALTLSSLAVLAGALSGEIQGAPVYLALFAIAQTAEAIGSRELFRAVVGDDRLRFNVVVLPEHSP